MKNLIKILSITSVLALIVAVTISFKHDSTESSLKSNGVINFGEHIDGAKVVNASVILDNPIDNLVIDSNCDNSIKQINDTVYHVAMDLENDTEIVSLSVNDGSNFIVENTLDLNQVNLKNEETSNINIDFAKHINGAKDLYASVVLDKPIDNLVIDSNYDTTINQINDTVYHVAIDVEGKTENVNLSVNNGDNLIKEKTVTLDELTMKDEIKSMDVTIPAKTSKIELSVKSDNMLIAEKAVTLEDLTNAETKEIINFGKHVSGSTVVYANIVLDNPMDNVEIESNYDTKIEKISDTVYHVAIDITTLVEQLDYSKI